MDEHQNSPPPPPPPRSDSFGFLCVYILFDTLAVAATMCLTVFETPLCLRSEQASCWLWRTYFTSCRAIVWLIYKRPGKKLFFPLLLLVELYKILSGNIFRWHTCNVCRRTRCSIHNTTPPVQCVAKPVEYHHGAYTYLFCCTVNFEATYFPWVGLCLGPCNASFLDMTWNLKDDLPIAGCVMFWNDGVFAIT